MDPNTIEAFLKACNALKLDNVDKLVEAFKNGNTSVTSDGLKKSDKDGESAFKKPKKSARKRCKISIQEETPVSNRFEVFTDTEEEMEITPTEDNIPKPEPRPVTPTQGKSKPIPRTILESSLKVIPRTSLSLESVPGPFPRTGSLESIPGPSNAQNLPTNVHHQNLTQNLPTSSGNTNRQANIMKRERISNLILRNKSRWQIINKKIRELKINIRRVKAVSQGVQIEPASEDDYRNLFRYLRGENEEFHAYELRSEKKLKVVLRGVLVEISDDDIRADLADQGYPVSKIVRMKGKRGYPAPLVLVEIDKAYKAIFNRLEFCCGLSVIVESLRIRNSIIQCHRCQLFGHGQRNCHAAFKCMKCGEGHVTADCPKPITSLLKCANCGGDHLSFNIKCLNNPNNPDVRKPILQQAPLPKENIWVKRMEERNKLEEKKKTEEQKTNEEPRRPKLNKDKTGTLEDLVVILGRMTLMLSGTNATREQKMAFLEEQDALIKLFKQK